jgi:hypothetical protein
MADGTQKRAIKIAHEHYGLEEDTEELAARRALEKAVVHLVVESSTAARGRCPTVMVVWPDGDGGSVNANFQTIEEFERVPSKSHIDIRLRQVRKALATHPDSFAVCTLAAQENWPWPLTADEAASGFIVWAVDKTSLRVEKAE